jgi:metal-responsive CopG/Arc/MetJ family transcriptional regulator
VAERVITIKMPRTLVKELRSLTAEHHYLDLSEQVRSVVRQKCFRYATPFEDIKRVKTELEQQINDVNKQRKEEILTQLQRLLEGDK